MPNNHSASDTSSFCTFPSFCGNNVLLIFNFPKGPFSRGLARCAEGRRLAGCEHHSDACNTINVSEGTFWTFVLFPPILYKNLCNSVVQKNLLIFDLLQRREHVLLPHAVYQQQSPNLIVLLVCLQLWDYEVEACEQQQSRQRWGRGRAGQTRLSVSVT